MSFKVSLLLCTVRPSTNAYLEHPDWHPIGKVIEFLDDQTFNGFELVVVDGLYHERRDEVAKLAETASFRIVHVPPRQSCIWVQKKMVAISAYRNTGIVYASGELIANLDDCCVLPRNYVETIWEGWRQYGVAVAMTWPHREDSRTPGLVQYAGQVFGFGSFPRELALQLNGYDESFDGAQGLEDMDWSRRLFNARLKQGLVYLPGFDIPPQGAHDPRAINKEKPICKCCNLAWNAAHVWRDVQIANRADLWTPEALKRLVGPCRLLRDDKTCAHHSNTVDCGFYKAGLEFVTGLDPDAAAIFDHPPVIDLLVERRRGRVGGQGG